VITLKRKPAGSLNAKTTKKTRAAIYARTGCNVMYAASIWETPRTARRQKLKQKTPLMLKKTLQLEWHRLRVLQLCFVFLVMLKWRGLKPG
jgi:PIN domain nuclease of toxin-antitoxin system